MYVFDNTPAADESSRSNFLFFVREGMKLGPDEAASETQFVVVVQGEGDLTKRRAMLMRGSFLAGMAREIGLDACLRLGANEESTGGRRREAALEDAFEALVGAVSLDAGLEAARAVVLGLYGDLPARLASLEVGDNPKGRLQEIVQPLHGNGAVRYEVLSTSGADHERTYEVGVFLLDRRIGTGRGSSKKVAEEEAARAALEEAGAGPLGG